METDAIYVYFPYLKKRFFWAMALTPLCLQTVDLHPFTTKQFIDLGLDKFIQGGLMLYMSILESVLKFTK